MLLLYRITCCITDFILYEHNIPPTQLHTFLPVAAKSAAFFCYISRRVVGCVMYTLCICMHIRERRHTKRNQTSAMISEGRERGIDDDKKDE